MWLPERLQTIGYHLSDSYMESRRTTARPGERVIQLPDCFWCYDPLTKEPAVNALPALSAGYVTFGCLNNFLQSE